MDDFFYLSHDSPVFSFNSSDFPDMLPHHKSSSLSSLMNSDFVDFDSSRCFSHEITRDNMSVTGSHHEPAVKICDAGTGYKDGGASQSTMSRDGNDNEKWKQDNGVTMWNGEKERSSRRAAGIDNKQKKAIQESQPRTRVKRGHATDSHSIAERERRQKIKSRMKLLQSMIPGCDQIRGKIQILDEIIGYIQTLQNQVEMQAEVLAFVNPMLSDFKENVGTSALSAEMLRRSIHMGSSSDVVAPNSAIPLLQGNCGYNPQLMSQDSMDINFTNNS